MSFQCAPWYFRPTLLPGYATSWRSVSLIHQVLHSNFPTSILYWVSLTKRFGTSYFSICWILQWPIFCTIFVLLWFIPILYKSGVDTLRLVLIWHLIDFEITHFILWMFFTPQQYIYDNCLCVSLCIIYLPLLKQASIDLIHKNCYLHIMNCYSYCYDNSTIFCWTYFWMFGCLNRFLMTNPMWLWYCHIFQALFRWLEFILMCFVLCLWGN